jgi:hypothetical protein
MPIKPVVSLFVKKERKKERKQCINVPGRLNEVSCQANFSPR